MNEGATYSLPVHCSRACGKTTDVGLKEAVPGVFKIVIPKYWLFSSDKGHILFICEDCAKTIGYIGTVHKDKHKH